MKLFNHTVLLGLAVTPTAIKAVPIVGGTQIASNLNPYPYVVSIRRDSSHICGGTLINLQQILTAAQCVDGVPQSSLTVRVGSTSIASGGTVIGLQKIRVHPSYSSITFKGDIAIIDLATSVSNIQPARLPLPASTPQAGSTVTDVGWGATTQGGGSQTLLRRVDVSAISLSSCQGAYGSTTVGPSQFCAGVTGGGKSACGTDLGGPVVQGNTVVGIISFGRGCAQSGYPFINTRVGAYVVWILEQELLS